MVALLLKNMKQWTAHELIFAWEADGAGKIPYLDPPALIADSEGGLISLGNHVGCGTSYDFFRAKGKETRVGLRVAARDGTLSAPLEVTLDLTEWMKAREWATPRPAWYCVPRKLFVEDESSWDQIRRLKDSGF